VLASSGCARRALSGSILPWLCWCCMPVNMMPPALAPGYHVVGDQLRGAGAPSVELDNFARADMLGLPAMEWIWPNVLPAGEFALLAGAPKVGKSQIAVDLAARLTNGAVWPDGAPGASPGGVILIETEVRSPSRKPACAQLALSWPVLCFRPRP
jgi:hypothetical protein